MGEQDVQPCRLSEWNDTSRNIQGRYRHYFASFRKEPSVYPPNPAKAPTIDVSTVPSIPFTSATTPSTVTQIIAVTTTHGLFNFQHLLQKSSLSVAGTHRHLQAYRKGECLATSWAWVRSGRGDRGHGRTPNLPALSGCAVWEQTG